MKRKQKSEPVCNRDCLNCLFDDCIRDEMTHEDYKALRKMDFICGAKETPDAKIAAKRKAYREANREEIAAYQKAYYEANREEIAAKRKAYREAKKKEQSDDIRAQAFKKTKKGDEQRGTQRSCDSHHIERSRSG